MVAERYIVTTRPASKAQPASEKYCFSIVNVPLTEIKKRELDDIRREILSFNPDMFVITSEVVSQMLLEMNALDRDDVLICIGDKSASPLKSANLPVKVPTRMNSSGIVELLSVMNLEERRIALCRSSVHSTLIDNFLSDHEREFRSFDMYDVSSRDSDEVFEKLENDGCVGVLVTSSMEASLLVELANRLNKMRVLKEVHVFVIGKPTRERLEGLGISPEPLEAESSMTEILREISKKHCYSGEWI